MNSNNPINKRVWYALFAISIISLAAHLVFFPQLPDQVPLQWNASGAVSSWGGRETALGLFAMPLIVLTVLYVSPKIDPRGIIYRSVSKLYTGIAIAFTLFMVALSWCIELTVFGIMPQDGSPMSVVTTIALGVGALFLGNYLPRVQRNYTFGYKTPWALDNDQNWRLTHRFAGAVTMFMGVALIAVGLCMPFLPAIAPTVILVAILGGAALVFAYSYLLYRRGNVPFRSANKPLV